MNLYRITDCVRRDMCTNIYIYIHGLEVLQPRVYMECILYAIFSMAGSPRMIFGFYVVIGMRSFDTDTI